MYNLYIYQKQKLKQEKEKQDKKKEDKISKKRKEELNTLTKNYSKRVEKFVNRMIDDPVIIKDSTFTNYPCSFPNVKGQYSFRDLLSEIELKDLINNTKKSIPFLIQPTIFQPQMRFKPKNDFERINDTQKSNDCFGFEAYNNFIDNEKIRKEISTKKRIEQIKAIDKKRKNDTLKKDYFIKSNNMPQTIHKVSHSFSQKTFFNATNQILINHISDKDIDDSEESKRKNFNELFQSSLNIFGRNPSSTKIFKKHQFNINNEIRKDSLDLDDNDKFNSFHNPFVKNPYKLNKSLDNKTKDSDILYLKKISKNQILNTGSSDAYNLPSYENIVLQDKSIKNINKLYKDPSNVYHMVKIGKEVFRKDDVKNITKNILYNCGYTHKKLICENNSLKKGIGKLMATKGVDIKTFLSKHSLPNFY